MARITKKGRNGLYALSLTSILALSFVLLLHTSNADQATVNGGQNHLPFGLSSVIYSDVVFLHREHCFTHLPPGLVADVMKIAIYCSTH